MTVEKMLEKENIVYVSFITLIIAFILGETRYTTFYNQNWEECSSCVISI